MCIAAPGKIIEIFFENSMRMGRIDYGGVTKTACLEYVPEAEIGHWVMVHAGFAISVVDESAAQEFYQLWEEVDRATPKREGEKQ